MKEEEDEERLAEEKLRQLQEFAEKSVTERNNSTQPSSSSQSSLSSKGCLKSSWQQIGNLLLYTAAGVKGSDKVGHAFLFFFNLFQCREVSELHSSHICLFK